MEVLPDDRSRWSSDSNSFAPYRSKAARHSRGGAFVLSIRVDASHSSTAPQTPAPAPAQQQQPVKIIVNGTGDRQSTEETFHQRAAAARQEAIIASTPTVKIVSTLPARLREETVISQVQVLPVLPEASRIRVEPEKTVQQGLTFGSNGFHKLHKDIEIVPSIVSEINKGTVAPLTLEVASEPMVTDVTVVSEVLKVPLLSNGHPESSVSVRTVTPVAEEVPQERAVTIATRSPVVTKLPVECRVSPEPQRSPVERITPPVVQERTYEERLRRQSDAEDDVDGKMHFHLSVERGENASKNGKGGSSVVAEDSGAGGLLMPGAVGTIRSSRGTVRGVKNRVRAGIAAFLQHENSHEYRDKERGKVVLYTTSMGVVRRTFHKCLRVKQILRTLLVPFEERDASTSAAVREEIQRRLGTLSTQGSVHSPPLPQLFVEGQHVGDAEEIERLNEAGELRRMLKPFQNPDAAWTCNICGGYQRLPCAACGGSKRSSKRNAFTEEFVALRCMVCDEAGLVRCTACT